MRRVLSVGQCSFDHGNLSRAFRNHFQAELIPTVDEASAIRDFSQGDYDLVLVNRLFDEDGASGLEFLKKHIHAFQTAQTPVMLVSNFPEAQAEAMALGARRGIGKSSLGTDGFLQAVREAVPSWSASR